MTVERMTGHDDWFHASCDCACGCVTTPVKVCADGRYFCTCCFDGHSEGRGILPYYDRDGLTIYRADIRHVLKQTRVRLIPKGAVLLTDPPYGVFFFKRKTAYEIGTGDWSSDVCSSDLRQGEVRNARPVGGHGGIHPHRLRAGHRGAPRNLRARGRDAGHSLHELLSASGGCRMLLDAAAVNHGPWGFTTFNPILYYGKDFRAGKGPLPTGMEVTEASEKLGHPCAKPIKAWSWLLDKVSEPGDTIIDPFMGSGTTLRAAKDLGRKAIGVEIDVRYANIAVERLGQEVLFT